MLKTKVPRTETHAIEWLGLHCGLSYVQGHKRELGARDAAHCRGCSPGTPRDIAQSSGL